MVHKKIKKTIMIIILIIVILLFISLNLSIFIHKLSFARESIQACQGLEIGDSCLVETCFIEEEGVCSLYKKEKLVCRIKKSR